MYCFAPSQASWTWGDMQEDGIGNHDSKFGGGIGRYAYLGLEMRFDD